MKISNKVKLLELAFDALFQQREEAIRNYTEMLFEFQDEIGDYFKAHLPEQNKIYGNGVLIELKDITEQIFKNVDSPKRKELPECLGRLSIAAHFIPQSEQDV